MSDRWPEIPYGPWRDTCAAFLLYAQMIGKYRLARTPWLNHSWHATFYPNARGFTTGLVQDGSVGIELAFDLIDHAVDGSASDGRKGRVPLEPMSAAEFRIRLMELIAALGGTADFDGRPNELADPKPFRDDTALRPWDAAAVTRFFRATVAASGVMREFRTAFLGKSSPVHLFWGSLDLAVTRFSGRRAPLHPGGFPALPDAVTREAYSHEVSSAGFWPGGGPVDYPAFYSYAYPVPKGFASASVLPEQAFFHDGLGEFILPYDAVRTARDPESALMAFLQSTYRAAADLGDWDSAALECAIGEPRRPRAVF